LEKLSAKEKLFISESVNNLLEGYPFREGAELAAKSLGMDVKLYRCLDLSGNRSLFELDFVFESKLYKTVFTLLYGECEYKDVKIIDCQ